VVALLSYSPTQRARDTVLEKAATQDKNSSQGLAELCHERETMPRRQTSFDGYGARHHLRIPARLACSVGADRGHAAVTELVHRSAAELLFV
jgi:hypothetical protein